MKKNLPLVLLVVLVVAGAAYFVMSKDSAAPGAKNPAPKSASSQNASGKTEDGEEMEVVRARSSSHAERQFDPEALPDVIREQLEAQEYEDVEEKPAAQVYKTADDALKAVKAGAADYDDVVLEQFTQPGEDCTWCDSFYKSLRDSLIAGETSDDEKSYYGEILAISGKVDNIKSLVEAIKSAGDNEKGDIFAEALELTLGGENVVRYLGEELGADNQLLKESLIAAITNQDSRLAADLLYNQTVKNGDADGYYSLGIGLGEFVPGPEALPYLQDLMLKRDQYSHLATKSLLNSGVDGLKIVLDVLAGSKDPESDRQYLKDAVDHVSYDDEVEQYLKIVVQNPRNAVMGDFAKQVLDEFAKSEDGEEAAESP